MPVRKAGQSVTCRSTQAQERVLRSQTRTGGRDFYTVTAGIFFITLLPILLTVCSGRTGDTGQSAPTAPDSEAAALRVKGIIDSWQPDLVIAAEDAASKYLVMPYFRNRDLPFIFIGVNWDAGPYGYPYRNVTGQVEIELIKELISELRKYARGNRLGILCGNTLTDRKTVEYYKNILEINFNRAMFVNTFEDWQRAYSILQNEVDILIVRNNAGITGWEETLARSYILDKTRIVTGAVIMHIVQYVLLSYAKIDYEMGEYAGVTALRILSGTPGSGPGCYRDFIFDCDPDDPAPAQAHYRLNRHGSRGPRPYYRYRGA